MKSKKFLMILMLLLMIAYRGLSHGSLRSDLRFTNYDLQDSLIPIAPRGYVLLSYAGARNALKIKAEASACERSSAVKDSINNCLSMKVAIAEMRTSELKQVMIAYKHESRILKRKLFFSYLYGVGISVLFGYYVLK